MLMRPDWRFGVHALNMTSDDAERALVHLAAHVPHDVPIGRPLVVTPNSNGSVQVSRIRHFGGRIPTARYVSSAFRAGAWSWSSTATALSSSGELLHGQSRKKTSSAGRKLAD